MTNSRPEENTSFGDINTNARPEKGNAGSLGDQTDEPRLSKKKTSRIPLAPILGEVEPLKKSTSRISGAPASIPQTVRLRRPSPISPHDQAAPKRATERIFVSEAPTVPRQEFSKSQTSRIILPDLTAGSESVPQTIKLKRPQNMPVPAIPGYDQAKAKLTTDRVPASEAPTIARRAASKSQTSRIVLPEIPPGGDGQAHVQTGQPTPTPKTIKIQRPSTADEGLAQIASLEETIVNTARKTETARIDIVPEQVAPVPLTERKTIKIKRTERSALPRTVTLSRSDAASESKAREEAPDQLLEEEKVGPLFSLIAVAALLVLAAVTYLLAAELFAAKFALPIPDFLVM